MENLHTCREPAIMSLRIGIRGRMRITMRAVFTVDCNSDCICTAHRGAHGHDLFHSSFAASFPYPLMPCCLDPLLPMGFAVWILSCFRCLAWWVSWISIESVCFGPGSMAGVFVYIFAAIGIQQLKIYHLQCCSSPVEIPWRLPEPSVIAADLQDFAWFTTGAVISNGEGPLLNRIQPMDTEEFPSQEHLSTGSMSRIGGTTQINQKARVKFDVFQASRPCSIEPNFTRILSRNRYGSQWPSNSKEFGTIRRLISTNNSCPADIS